MSAPAMRICRLNPLEDPRWAELVRRHPRSSVFHTQAWLGALRRTYGYEPVVFTTSPPGEELRNGVVFCEVRSWLTGRRLVSLPFSDHCEPLVDDGEELSAISSHLRWEQQHGGWRSLELRPCTTSADGFGRGQAPAFYLHVLDLTPGADRVFRAFHEAGIQRKIRRAEREGLICEDGRHERLFDEFYELLLLTRQRHGLPPQPREWFRHLAAEFGPALTVRVARRGAQSIAAILTLIHRGTIVYKYGASDAAQHRWGAMQLLLWNAIQDACARGCTSLDLGRSDAAQDGLLTFKDRWGATRLPLTYWRYPATSPVTSRLQTGGARIAQLALGHAPSLVRMTAGRILYKHAG